MKSRVLGKGAPTAQVPVDRTEDNRAGLMSIYEDKLRQWPVPPETFFLATRYGKTHVSRAGILHLRRWSSFIRKPPARWRGRRYSRGSGRYRIYAPDTISDVGRSELDDFDVYPKKSGDFSAWLGDLYAGLGIGRADVIGGSMGGWVAMHRAISAPGSVRKLVLLGPTGLASWRTTLMLLGADDVPGASPD